MDGYVKLTYCYAVGGSQPMRYFVCSHHAKKNVSRRMVIAGCQRETIFLKWAGCGDGGGGGGLNYINVSFFNSLNLTA